jgi:hypothetical protein
METRHNGGYRAGAHLVNYSVGINSIEVDRLRHRQRTVPQSHIDRITVPASPTSTSTAPAAGTASVTIRTARSPQHSVHRSRPAIVRVLHWRRSTVRPSRSIAVRGLRRSGIPTAGIKRAGVVSAVGLTVLGWGGWLAVARRGIASHGRTLRRGRIPTAVRIVLCGHIGHRSTAVGLCVGLRIGRVLVGVIGVHRSRGAVVSVRVRVRSHAHCMRRHATTRILLCRRLELRIGSRRIYLIGTLRPGLRGCGRCSHGLHLGSWLAKIPIRSVRGALLGDCSIGRGVAVLREIGTVALCARRGSRGAAHLHCRITRWWGWLYIQIPGRRVAATSAPAAAVVRAIFAVKGRGLSASILLQNTN